MKKLLIVLLVLGFAAPAMAADFYFYGSLRPHLGYYDTDEDYSGGPAMDPSIAGNANIPEDDSGLLMSLGGQSRIGVKAVAGEDFYGVVEFGLRENNKENNKADTSDEESYLRLAYGVWNFGAGKLTVGKDYTPATFLGYSRMHGDLGDNGDANLLTAGLTYISRQPQVKLSFGSFEIALIEQHTEAPEYAEEGYGDKDFDLPRIEAAYVFRTEMLNIRPVLGFQTYDVEGPAGDESIDSFVAGLGVSADLKPAYVKATISYQQNPGNYGNPNVANVAFRNAVFDPVDGDVNDADTIQGTLVAGYKVNKMVNLEAGLSYQNSEVDLAPGVTGEQTGMVYYGQAWISMSQNVHIIPEVGMVDRGDLEVDGQPDVELGKMTYFDVNFRVDF